MGKNELNTAAKLVNWCPEPAAIIQVGVGYGIEAPIFKDAWPNALLIGADPHPRVTRRGKYPGILIKKAVADKSGERPFFMCSRWPCSGLDPAERSHGSRVVPVTTLDAIISEHDITGRIVLWLDCEGGEYDALRGGSQALSQCDFLHIEMWLHANHHYEDLVAIIRGGGFRIIDRVRSDCIYKRMRTPWSEKRTIKNSIGKFSAANKRHPPKPD